MRNKLKAYTYDILEKDVEILKKNFPDVEYSVIGESCWGRKLYYIRLGHGKKKISFNGAHHGMEWITSVLLMKFAGDFLWAEIEDETLNGFSVRSLAEQTSLYVVPMVNPDGVELSATGRLPDGLSEDEKSFLLSCNGSEDFERWQANARGVDLNHNYDALWGKSKAMEKEYNIYGPGPTRFSGTAPFSEPESKALADFTDKMNFDMTMAFHSQGKVIYYSFGGEEPLVSLKIAKALEIISPYRIDYAEGMASVGGYKDWFVHKFRRPGFTIEVGEGKNPLPFESFPVIYKETLPLLLGAMTV